MPTHIRAGTWQRSQGRPCFREVPAAWAIRATFLGRHGFPRRHRRLPSFVRSELNRFSKSHLNLPVAGSVAMPRDLRTRVKIAGRATLQFAEFDFATGAVHHERAADLCRQGRVALGQSTWSQRHPRLKRPLWVGELPYPARSLEESPPEPHHVNHRPKRSLPADCHFVTKLCRQPDNHQGALESHVQVADGSHASNPATTLSPN